jgi:hypothetical protein
MRKAKKESDTPADPKKKLRVETGRVGRVGLDEGEVGLMTFSSDERSKLVSTLSNSLALFIFIFIFFATETHLKVHTALTGIKKRDSRGHLDV